MQKRQNLIMVCSYEFTAKSIVPRHVNDLIFAPSAFTAEELKCYKSMAAYDYYVSGFVKEVGVKLFGNICFVFREGYVIPKKCRTLLQLLGF